MSKIALVTGANQGLGLALVQALASRLGPQDIVYLASHSLDRGQDALSNLAASPAEVRLIQLDVTDQNSIAEMATHMTREHGGLDIVVSNAAARMYKDRSQAEQVRAFIATNNHGSCNLLKSLAPLLKPEAHYLIVASSFGQLRNLPENLHPLFDTETLSLDDIENSMDHYVAAMEAGTAVSDGWPEWMNIPSKIGQVATARIAARDIGRRDKSILINAVCPGLMDTAASRPWFDDMSDALSTDDAAKPIVDLLLSPSGANSPHGQLLQYGKVLPWT